MKAFCSLLFIAMLHSCSYAQETESFDLISYAAPKGWKKQSKEGAVTYSTEDTQKGSFAVLALYKAMPGAADSKHNFEAAWQTLVKEMVTTSTEAKMEAPVSEDGWELQSGYAPFETEGVKGVAMLVTISGYSKMANIVILTNAEDQQTAIGEFLESVKMLKPTLNEPGTASKPDKQTSSAAVADSYTFTSTNFDDGWTSIVNEDYIAVSKGVLKALIFYKIPITEQMRPPVINVSDYFWNKDVKSRYTILSEERRVQELMYTQTDYIEGDAVDQQTGERLYIGMLIHKINGVATTILVTAPDKAGFLQAFPNPRDLEKMMGYNRFAVGANDIIGNWSESGSAYAQMYNTVTGDYAGMKGVSTNAEFFIKAGGAYSSKHSGVSGYVGSQQYFKQEYKGKYTVSNWEMSFTNRFEGKTDLFHVWFEVIRDGRVLHLQDKKASGIQYDLFREN